MKVRLAGSMETALITLYGKALDAGMTPSLLHDTMAAQAVERIDYDFGRIGMTPRLAPNVAARSLHFDGWAREFLARHEQATVVHLGAGLDTRVWRVDPGPGVRWYEVDYPEVVAVRRQLYPERENYQLIGCSATAPEWLAQVPADRPTLVLGEGLLMYLEPAQGHELLRRITDRFPSGVFAGDTHNRLAVRMVNRNLARTFGAPLLRWAIEDPHELERANPALRLTDAVSALSSPSLPRATRILATLTRPVRAVRDLGMYLRLEFGPQG
ncbi:class I SAM-dependent methyltransferase [Kutzneria viridogrisea]|uniref:O-methyltransferase involved in polyketide biosynthesis n=1 Tax=Kutzneria viridogrisea TaxID=47990 RepID=A0ABR6BJP1_9PSEU|nr:O-methyltransferase involved in polyketide biosynthesis [Kutzneria viridogrisea]